MSRFNSLREKSLYLIDRCGETGVFDAYFTGPECLEDYVSIGRKLPAETRAFVKSLHESMALAPLPTTKPQAWKSTAFVPLRLHGFSAHQTPFVTSIKPSDEP